MDNLVLDLSFVTQRLTSKREEHAELSQKIEKAMQDENVPILYLANLAELADTLAKEIYLLENLLRLF